ncbi:hypothetical protein [Agrobacterium arsenijevicii]|uniref:Uncharacterized protein n=2 Tax=Agrobacterium arsenijevicii TaxID=1585697 RepID=A0ABR5DC22_9HYPH|nr:hypothetical protein RP75_05795 [Agrobacterium arsenijevicii]
MIFKTVDFDGNNSRFAVAFEALTHLQKQIEVFVAENQHLRDPALSNDDFLSELLRTRPQMTEIDSEGVSEEEFKARFFLISSAPQVLLRSLDLNGRVEDFLLSFETLWYLGLRIEGMLQQLRS